MSMNNVTFTHSEFEVRFYFYRRALKMVLVSLILDALNDYFLDDDLLRRKKTDLTWQKRGGEWRVETAYLNLYGMGPETGENHT